MKRMFLVAAIILLFILSGHKTPVQAAQPDTQCQPAASIEAILFSHQDHDSARIDLGMAGNPVELNHGGLVPDCGEYCEVEGASGGCVYFSNNGRWVRTTATCRNGQWTPSP
jgi:hypothetical protein